MTILNKLSKNVLNKSHNKLHGLCEIVFKIIFNDYFIIWKVPQSSSEFQAQIQPQRPGKFFQCLTKKGTDAEYPFEHGEVIN